jgi:hypothetical protein
VGKVERGKRERGMRMTLTRKNERDYDGSLALPMSNCQPVFS